MTHLKTNLGKLILKNPIMVASGTFGYGEEFHGTIYDISRLGAVVTKGISLEPREGNPMPRVIETPSGMLNAIGLQNVGIEKFLSEKLPFLVGAGATTIVNVLGRTIDDYVELSRRLKGVKGIDAIEINISCPNVKSGGVQFGIDAKLAGEVTRAVRDATDTFVIVKLSPQASDIPAMARSIRDAGADAISLINTIPAIAIDIKKRKPVLANVIGGLSGPAIKPVALRMVYETNKALNGDKTKDRYPIIGMGGIMSVNDVIEFLLAGSDAVQIGTANFIRPSIAVEIIEGLSKYLAENSIAHVSELVAGA